MRFFQFGASLPAASAQAAAATIDPTSIGHDTQNTSINELLPGRLQSIQLGITLKDSAAKWAGRSDRERGQAADKKPHAARVSQVPEPLNYLRLRRTQHSKAALRRNREVAASVAAVAAREIVAPSLSSSPKRKADDRVSNNMDSSDTTSLAASPVRTQPLTAIDPTAMLSHPPSPTKSNSISAIESQLQAEARRLQEQHERETNAASLADRQLKSLLLDLRRSQLARMSPPLLRVYERHKLRSRWSAWLGFVEWHRQESARLVQLTPFVVRIQRTFRLKRLSSSTSLEALRRARLVILYRQWGAAIAIQHAARRWLRRRERYRQSLTRYASRLQAVWRGRRECQEFHKTLKMLIRALLTRLAPAGSLHRLRDLAFSVPKLAAAVNGMLTLLTETPVAVDRGRIPDYTIINGKRYARKRPPEPPKVEATRAQLVHAVLMLRALVQERERQVQDAKLEFVDAQQQVRARREAHERGAKAQRLQATNERLWMTRELRDMDIAERETREYVRALRSVDEDERRRALLREQRREWHESERIRDEEAQTRYVMAERAQREVEARAKHREIARHEQLLREQAEREEAARRAVLEEDARRQQELARRRLETEAEERAKWNALSLELKSEVTRREEEARMRALAARASESDTIDEAAARLLLKEQQRRAKHAELERERSEREMMAACDAQSRQWHFAAKKQAHEHEWRAKRERERLRYAADPLQFEKAQAQLEQEEARRRENYALKLEDERSRTIRDREQWEELSKQLREQTRARLARQKCEANERELMGVEEQIELARVAAEKRADEYQRLLRDMQSKTQKLTTKQREQLAEARSRCEMRDEELRQLSVARAEELAAIAREERERSAMQRKDRRAQQVEVEQAKYERKRRREQATLRMMRADVESMAGEDWEREGARLEALLWTPMESAAIAINAELHLTFLHENVRVFIELTEGSAGLSPPLELDYDAVRANSEREHAMREQDVPDKKRRPRKFFYHEFFEEDPILGPMLNKERGQETALRQREGDEKKAAARKRWQQLAQHYLPCTLGSGEYLFHTRRGIALMADKRLDDARTAFVRAIDSFSRPEGTDCSCKPPPPSLLRQLARCNVALYELSGRRECLDGAMLRFQQAAAHVWLVGNPQFLEELARGLELAGKDREAAETLAAIIRGFPRYSRLSEVVFRAGVVLFTLHEFRQSREYLLHVLDDSPFGWQAADVLFLVARVLQREGDPAARRLSALAFEEAFRKKRDAGELDLDLNGPRRPSASIAGMSSQYATWLEFVTAPDTWRRAGDRYFARGEFALTKDAFSVMAKRKQQHRDGPSMLTQKRRAVAAAVLQHEQLQQGQHQNGETASSAIESSRTPDDVNDDDDDPDDWLRVANAYAAVQDRAKAAGALSKWLERASYTERVRERFFRWPIARWKLLTGSTAPAKVVQWRQEQAQVGNARRKERIREAWSESRVVGAASTGGSTRSSSSASAMASSPTEVAEYDTG